MIESTITAICPPSRSVIAALPPRYGTKGRDYVNVPGMSSALLWATETTPRVPHDGNDPISEKSLYVPPVGETRLMIVTFPPDSVMMSSSFNSAAAGQEYMEHMPELAQTFELDNPGMHTTDTGRLRHRPGRRRLAGAR